MCFWPTMEVQYMPPKMSVHLQISPFVSQKQSLTTMQTLDEQVCGLNTWMDNIDLQGEQDHCIIQYISRQTHNVCWSNADWTRNNMSLLFGFGYDEARFCHARLSIRVYLPLRSGSPWCRSPCRAACSPGRHSPRRPGQPRVSTLERRRRKDRGGGGEEGSLLSSISCSVD